MGLTESNPSSRLIAVGLHECVTCLRCATTFAAVHPACPYCSAREEIERYRRALSAHHDLSTLSDEVIREYDFRECPVCRRARDG